MRTATPGPHLQGARLAWLLLGLLLALVPLFAHLQLWVGLAAVALGAWRYLLMRRRLPLPPPWLRVPLVLAGAAGILASHPGGFGRDAGVALLVLMLGLKLLEADSRRDAILLVYAAWFLGFTLFLFSQSLLLGLYVLLPTAVLGAALLGIAHPHAMPDGMGRLRLSCRMLLQAVPLMLVLFLLFPRLSGPLWGVPRDALDAMTGLSENMAPGSIGQLSISDAVAFRAEFSGPVPPAHQRYWRGPVFWHFDGYVWRPGTQARNLPEAVPAVGGGRTDYTVTLEPHNRRWLFLLDMPAELPRDAVLRPGQQVYVARAVHRRLRYAAASLLDYRLDLALDPSERDLALQLPAGSNPRTRALGQAWADSGAAPATLVERALRMFREQEFVYTLNPPRLEGHSVDAFLFDTRRGFCEHYAGSFVFLMRAAGVPARVVTGYQGGTINPIGGYLIVRQSDAHAWAEAWLPEHGWVRVDPTAAVAPQRIEAGVASALPAGEALPRLAGEGLPLLRQLYLGLDALNNGWNQWVLGYDQQRQRELLSWLYGNGIGMREVVQAMVAALALLLCGSMLAWLRGGRHGGHRLDRAFLRFEAKLGRRGLRRRSWEGALDYAARAARALPQRAEAIRAIAADYVAQRYGRAGTPQRYRTLIDNIRKFRP